MHSTITLWFHEGRGAMGARANFWDAQGRYSTKTCIDYTEAAAFINACKNRKSRFE